MGSWTPPGQLFCRLHLRYTFSRSHWLAELGKLSGSIYRIQHAVKQGQSSGRFIVYSVNFTHLMSSWTEHLPCITSCAEPPACALRKGISWKKTHLTMWIILKPTYDCLEPAWYFRSKLQSKTSTDACINPNCPNNPKHTQCELIKHSNVATWVSKSHLLM